MLRNVGALRTEYSSDFHDIAGEFYDPCLREANVYDRITGFFSSAVFALLSGALDAFFTKNGGHMRLLCSPRLSQADADGLLYGYAALDDMSLADALGEELSKLLASPYADSARLLAALIATGKLEVRLAQVAAAAKASDKRMFHDKVGLFRDSVSDVVGFRGSMNESYLGLSAVGHIDSIDVWPSWESGRDAERVQNATSRFAKLWGGEIQGVTIASVPDEFRKVLEQIAGEADLPTLLRASSQGRARLSPAHFESLGGIRLRDHQVRGVEAWIDNGHRGVLAHATGSGKTVSGLQCARLGIAEGLVPIIVVPSALLLNQWSQQVRDLLGVRVLLVGDDHSAWRTSGTLRAAIDAGRPDRPYVVVAVLGSATSESFRAQLRPVAQRCLLIADEVHRMGSVKARSILGWLEAPWRLGLSATPERANDPEGTQVLLEYFGGIVDRYSLKDAMDERVLAPYEYLPTWVELTEAEQDRWVQITAEIKRRYAIAQAPKAKPNSREQLARKLIERARIAKNALGKVALATRLVETNFRQTGSQKWLIYCDNQQQLSQMRSALESRGISSWEYHSQMRGDAESTLRLFDTNGGIIVAIKCLDEGVDIPAATHALVLASSRNPREFIQRRGRILRRAPEKTVATLMDVLVLPQRVDKGDPAWALVAGELSRALEFASWSISRSSESKLEEKWISMGLSLSDLAGVRTAGFEVEEDEGESGDG